MKSSLHEIFEMKFSHELLAFISKVLDPWTGGLTFHDDLWECPSISMPLVHRIIPSGFTSTHLLPRPSVCSLVKNGTKCSRMDQVKFVESRPYHFNFFNSCLPKISLGPFLNTLTQISVPDWENLDAGFKDKDCRKRRTL